MRLGKRTSTMKQMAYARQILGGEGTSKQQCARNAGYSPSVSRSISKHIEESQGFKNAMAVLARDSNNLALAAMEEFKARGFKDFKNNELIAALNAISSAWARFNEAQQPKKDATPKGNLLRTVVLQQVENQNITNDAHNPVPNPKFAKKTVEGEIDDPMDF